MAYRTLKSVFHQRDRAGLEVQEQTRRDSPSAIEWDLLIGGHRAFMVVTREIAVLIEKILTYEPAIRDRWYELPGSGRDDYMHRMVIDEIKATNDVEQVRSTRKEIGAALEALREDGKSGKRFAEMVRLYLEIGKPGARVPKTLDDLREIYDAVVSGEVDELSAPDGVRFRAGPVSIESGARVVHRGIVPESAIDEALTLMMSQNTDDEVPRLVRAVVAHFIFEYAHPFYDGNGRTGRYLLALDLREVLAPYASFTLSVTINDEKERYYRAFADAEEPLNRGDLTVFVTTMLEIIAEAQHRLLVDLSGRVEKLRELDSRIRDLVNGELLEALERGPGEDLSFDPEDLGALLFVLGQAWLFDVNRAVKLQSLVHVSERSVQFIRPRVQMLVDAGLVETVTRKPLRFRITADGGVLLGLVSETPAPSRSAR